ncbi:spore germination lipoprotein GerD [Paenibacillus apiarius]|uniref:Spore germination lipoprotein GerD n=1 Tax=Paenibacillus apiarius TaxID=46240 RepID=A0ABT4DTQ9_9BACL|nr:spore germination lipoprotein GerD [Paenibacillus apiarius]MCY9516307.1 spore germination lipoprotein GerD [Paenibacillus apiarius]MCY9520640.1 spore germination lipoprotein GerD [Paenibacillus apiarius]MCY9552495.1 spore germination lipoprotein GerD [Paenibacillus apiarius]MCY9561031.1 spore germination lipoprotein GerD [Paenibacillus apiarius]MCY9683288.1 spore germination lipoprotein GerD [Paenibacillus apiarius]
MKSKFIHLALTGVMFMFLMLLSACGMEQQASSTTMDYKDLKTMVVDILKTEEAQKAMQSSSSAGGGMKMQALNMQQQEQIRTAVKDTLISPDYQKTVEKVMTDPKFAGEFAKVVSKENKQIHKELIKDPAYQQSVGDIIKSPDMMKSYLDMMKTPEYRKQLMAVLKDSMSSPIFRLEVMDLLGKVVKEELQPKEQGGKEGKGGEQGGGGGESGGGGGGDDGGSES